MRSLGAVFSSAQRICSISSGLTPSRRPTKRIRTPCSWSSGVSPRMRAENIAISASTSSCGRDQFSVENEYTVSSRIPRSTASRKRALTVSAPASCPSSTGNPRCWAQRPLPSVMMATYVALIGRPRPGEPPSGRLLPAKRARRARLRRSHFEDLGFLAPQQGLELLDLVVGQLLQRLFRAVLVVGARLAGVAQLLEVVHDVAADVAQRDLALLGEPAHDLDELLAPLLGQLREDEPDERAVVVRREAEVGLHDRAFDRLDRALVVRLDGQHPRLGGRDRGELLERGLAAVVIDGDAVQERRAGPAGAHGLKLQPGGLHGLVHMLARVLEEFVDHVVTSVPTRSPETIRLMFESSAMLNTWMGR